MARAEVPRAFVVASIPVPAKVMNSWRTPETPASTLARIPMVKIKPSWPRFPLLQSEEEWAALFVLGEQVQQGYGTD